MLEGSWAKVYNVHSVCSRSCESQVKCWLLKNELSIHVKPKCGKCSNALVDLHTIAKHPDSSKTKSQNPELSSDDDQKSPVANHFNVMNHTVASLSYIGSSEKNVILYVKAEVCIPFKSSNNDCLSEQCQWSGINEMPQGCHSCYNVFITAVLRCINSEVPL